MGRLTAALALTATIGVGGVTWSDVLGPEWVEDDDGGGDAGTTPGDAQTTTGVGGLGSIRGKLSGLSTGLGSGDQDFDDVFLICIDDPSLFMATTELEGGFSEFDSRLYLFDAVGFGLLGNEVPPNCPPAGEAVCQGATIGNTTTDATGVVVDQSGLYLLAITVAPREPVSDDGPIFDVDQQDEVSGPDGPGGGAPLVGWQDPTGCPGTGDCFEPNGTPGCEDALCCETVCATDPFCCDTAWDEICADEAVEVCFAPPGACCLKGSCVVIDARLCDVSGGLYMGDGTTCRGVECSGGGGCPGNGSCFEPHETPGCNDPSCCEIVCSIDSFCCEVAWDSGCVEIASSACTFGAVAESMEPLGGGTGDDGDYLIILDGACFATSVPTGRCELPDGCQDTTQYECRMLGGKFLGNGTSCPANDCNGNGIPDDEETAPENDPLATKAMDNAVDAELVCTDIFYDDDTFDATNDATVFCDLVYGGEHDVWYRYRPKGDGLAVAKVCTFDFGWIAGAPARPVVSVHAGAPGTPDNMVACNYASAVGTNCGTIWAAEAGRDYWIRVAGQDDTRGTFQLEVKGPRCLLNPSDVNENGIPDDCECLADVNGDGVVDAYDVKAVMAVLGSACVGCPEDVNGDEVVDEQDLAAVIAAMGAC